MTRELAYKMAYKTDQQIADIVFAVPGVILDYEKRLELVKALAKLFQRLKDEALVRAWSGHY